MSLVEGAENRTAETLRSRVLGALSTCPLGSPCRHLRDVTRGNSWSLLFYLARGRTTLHFVGGSPSHLLSPRATLARSLNFLLPFLAPFSRYTHRHRSIVCVEVLSKILSGKISRTSFAKNVSFTTDKWTSGRQ